MTPRQLITSLGFKSLPADYQTSNKYEYFGIRKDGKVVSRVGLEVGEWERNPTSAMVDVAGKRKTIYADYGDVAMKRFTDKQMQRLEELLLESIAAGPAPEKPKKPRPASPMKGKTLTDAQKRENAIWRHLGYLTCAAIDSYTRERMDYVRGPKFIRLEDWDNYLAYANIREDDLEKLGMTLKDLEAFLISKGVKRKAQKRVKRSYSLYD